MSLNYNIESYNKKLEEMERYSKMYTGFSCLDDNLNGIKPLLYILGGASSSGKTTFILQIITNLAKNNYPSLFYSFEQTEFELISKMVSSISYQYNKALSTEEAKDIANYNIVSDCFKYMEENNYDNIEIIEGNPDFTVSDIEQDIKKIKAREDNAPVIFIDYLQLLNANFDSYMTDKKRIDDIIINLKNISKKYQVPIIVISSINRGSYYSQIDFSAFKESGIIEYSADVILALEYSCMKNISFNDTNAKNTIERERMKEIKDIDIVCLKNRTGSTFRKSLKFLSKYSYFIELVDKDKSDSKKLKKL